MRRAALVLVMALAGCTGEEAPRGDACGAAGMQDLVGQGRDALAAMTLPAGTRVIEPGTKVTRDYRADRLNIEIDAAGVIVRVACG
jgi:hypothetical protein